MSLAMMASLCFRDFAESRSSPECPRSRQGTEPFPRGPFEGMYCDAATLPSLGFSPLQGSVARTGTGRSVPDNSISDGACRRCSSNLKRSPGDNSSTAAMRSSRDDGSASPGSSTSRLRCSDPDGFAELQALWGASSAAGNASMSGLISRHTTGRRAWRRCRSRWLERYAMPLIVDFPVLPESPDGSLRSILPQRVVGCGVFRRP